MPYKPAPQINDWIGSGRAFVRGIPIGGELLDEALAAGDATFGGDRSKSWGQRWNSAVDDQRAYDAAYDAKHPYLSAALQTAGNFAVPAGAIAGAVPKAAALFRLAGRTAGPLAKSALGRKLVEEMTEGMAVGAADGFLGGEGGAGERALHALKEMRNGAIWGAMRPVISNRVAKDYALGDPGRGAAVRRGADGILGGIEPDTPLLGLLPLPGHHY
jgi:hypothetical protein